MTTTKVRPAKNAPEPKTTLELTERERVALIDSVNRSLKLLKGGVDWDGDGAALAAVQGKLGYRR